MCGRDRTIGYRVIRCHGRDMQSQCINCTNHTYTVVHAQDMVCMALFVRYMYTAAVVGHGNFPTALSVHTILPAGRTVSSVH